MQLVEVQQLRGAVGGDVFCCLLTEQPLAKRESKSGFSYHLNNVVKYESYPHTQAFQLKKIGKISVGY